jgi:hypothetical protein
MANLNCSHVFFCFSSLVNDLMFKYPQPSELEEVWKSVKEDWTITCDGETSAVSFD